jgi:hypothetical protein
MQPQIQTGSISLQLKYCERCGGLWVKPIALDAIVCERCRQQLQQSAILRGNWRHAL